MPVILPRARANGALLGLKLRTGSAPSDAANLHPASEQHATLSPVGGSSPPWVQNCSPIAAVTPELASAPAKKKAVANHRCKGLWFLTTRGWVITRRFTSVVSLIIPLSQSRLSHRRLPRERREGPRCRAAEQRDEIAPPMPNWRTFVDLHRAPLGGSALPDP